MEDAGPTIVRPVVHDFSPPLDQLAEEAITERLVGVVRPGGHDVWVTAAAGGPTCSRRLVWTDWNIPSGVSNDPIAIVHFDEARGRVPHKGLGVLGVPPASDVGRAGKAGDGDRVLEGEHVDVGEGRNIGSGRWGEGQRHG